MVCMSIHCLDSFNRQLYQIWQLDLGMGSFDLPAWCTQHYGIKLYKCSSRKPRRTSCVCVCVWWIATKTRRVITGCCRSFAYNLARLASVKRDIPSSKIGSSNLLKPYVGSCHSPTRSPANHRTDELNYWHLSRTNVYRMLARCELEHVFLPDGPQDLHEYGVQRNGHIRLTTRGEKVGTVTNLSNHSFI